MDAEGGFSVGVGIVARCSSGKQPSTDGQRLRSEARHHQS